MKKELAYANPKYDVAGAITVGRRGHVVAATYSSDVEEAHYFDPKYQKLTASLSAVLPNQPLITIADSSADGTKHLLYAESSVASGPYGSDTHRVGKECDDQVDSRWWPAN